MKGQLHDSGLTGRDDPRAITRAFARASCERLEAVDRDLASLSAPGDARALDRIYAQLQDVNGACAELGFNCLQAVIDANQRYIVAIRDGELRFDRARTGEIRELVGTVRRSLEVVCAA